MNNFQKGQFKNKGQALQLSEKNETLFQQEQGQRINSEVQAQSLKLPLFLRNISEKVSYDNINSNKNSDGYNFTKRQKWTQQQDKHLQQLISQITNEEIDWERISEIMIKEGHKKTGKQCRERWFNQLDPKLNKAKWTLQENMELFLLHEQQGSRWKDIADHFEGRTDNSIKNQFFSLIRKSLRCARKLLDQGSNTALINKMKPKVLSEFMGKSIIIKVPANFTQNNIVQEENILIREFVKRFAFGDHHKYQQEVNDKDLFIIREVIDFLITLNNKYINCKKKKINKKKKQLQKLNKKKKNKKKKIDNQQQNDIQQNHQFKTEDKLNMSKALQDLAQQKQELELKNELYLKNPQYAFLSGEKEKIVSNLMKLGEIAYSMGQIINTSTRQEYEEFFNNQKDFFNQYLFSRQCSDESILQKINVKELLNNSEKEQNHVQQQSYDRFFNQSFKINNTSQNNDNIFNLNINSNIKNYCNNLNNSERNKVIQQNEQNNKQPLFISNQLNSSLILRNSQKQTNYNRQYNLQNTGNGLNQSNQQPLNISYQLQQSLNQSNNKQQLLNESYKYINLNKGNYLPRINDYIQQGDEKKFQNVNGSSFINDDMYQKEQLNDSLQQQGDQYLKQLINSSNINRNNSIKKLNQFNYTHNKIQKPDSIRIKRKTNSNNQNKQIDQQQSINSLQQNNLFTRKMSENKNQSQDIYFSNNSSSNP